MKKQFLSAISKLTLGALLFTLVASTNAHATTLNPTDKAADVKYLGSSDDAMLFNVSFDNPDGKKFSIIVLDEDGSQLFQEVYTEKKFSKRFKLPKADKNKLTFVIRDFKGADMKQTFEINTRFVEDVVVTKL
jgi:uncharacterized lipoprotein YajG